MWTIAKEWKKVTCKILHFFEVGSQVRVSLRSAGMEWNQDESVLPCVGCTEGVVDDISEGLVEGSIETVGLAVGT